MRIGGRTLALAVPQTYVNESGLAVRALVKRYLGAEQAPGSGDGGRGRGPLVFAPGSLVIVHDELDLEPGVVRVKLGGGTAGHNGLRSIQSHLRHLEFVRVRIGVGKPPNPAAGADYVLKRPRAPSGNCSTSPSRWPPTPSSVCSSKDPRRR